MQIASCVGHTDPVTGVDWTADSKFLQSVDASGSFRYWDATAATKVRTQPLLLAPPTPLRCIRSTFVRLPLLLLVSVVRYQVIEGSDSLRGANWRTWTCKGGWALSGLRPRLSTGITAVCRSNRADVLATVDEFGLVQ